MKSLHMSKKDKLKAIILIILTLCVVAFIFMHSLTPATLSAEESGAVTDWLTNLIPFQLTDHIVRKMAHMFVFCVLQIIVFSLFRALKMPFAKAAVFSILAVFGYACLDEFHQLFVDGRSGQFTDVMIDTFGGIIGLNIVILSKLFISFVKKIKQKYLSVDCCINK